MDNNSYERHNIRRYIDISGLDEYERPKAHVALTYGNCYSNGQFQVLQELILPVKPVVQVFKHAGFVNVMLDFLNTDDGDLFMAWDLLEHYNRPENSIDWSVEALNAGVYTDEQGNEQLVHFPMLELILSPIGKEDEYQFQGRNPAFYTLQANGPKGGPCVLQFTFTEDWFTLIEDGIDPVDIDAIRQEILEEMGYDMGAGIDPADLSALEE